jgi:sugar lactone lactonase YvrE
MNRGVAYGSLLLAAALLYFLLWPVPVDPVSWAAPVDRGLVDPFGPDDRLRAAVGINLGQYEGPEDATIGNDGRLYATTSSGHIVRIDGRDVSEFAFTGGRPLGIETAADGSLVIANAVLGLQRVDRNGNVTTLLNEVDGQPLVYANSLAIASTGMIYFSESSSKFGAASNGGTYDASLLDIMEHGGHGRLFAFDPASGAAEVLVDGLNFANGVATSSDDSFVLVSETGHYRVLRHWLSGHQAGSTEVLLDNLPGFPDNLKSGIQGRFWLGLAAPRNALLDKLSDKPFVRKMVQRLPAIVRPKAVPSSHVIAFNGSGEVLINLQDPSARHPVLTGVVETPLAIYLTTLYGNVLPRLDKQNL